MKRPRDDDELAYLLRVKRSDRIADRFEHRYTDVQIQKIEEKKKPRRRRLP
jgi:hypothetical protein